jgi:two-component system LytT family response regulator
MKVAIIDDEPDARSTLKQYIQVLIPNVQTEEANTVATGLQLIELFKPELVFLDVMMPDGTGFDLLNKIASVTFKVVIISGHEEFALKAFRFSAIDYLVKPIDEEELKETINRIKPVDQKPWQEMMEVLRQSLAQQNSSERKIVLRDFNTIYVVLLNTIIRCEATNNYTTFYFTNQKPIIVSKPLKEYDLLLSTQNFIRVHQSHLVNLHHIQQFNKKEGGSLLLSDGSDIPVATRKREQVLQALSKFL